MPYPCPFVYKSRKRCTGSIVRVAAFKADLEWREREDGSWPFEAGAPRSHYHVYCSEKGNHAGYGRDDDPQMKFYGSNLPDDVCAVISATTP